MIGTLIVVVIVVSALWVYLDATKNKIGKIPDEKGLWNMSAGNWAASTLILWIFGFPFYLVKRPALLKKAQETPIDPRNRALGVVLVAAAGIVWIGYTLVDVMSGSLPGCGSPQVMGLAEKIIRDSPLVKLSEVEITGVSNGGELDYDLVAERRTCRAILESELGQRAISYTVEWLDKGKGEYWVQVGE